MRNILKFHDSCNEARLPQLKEIVHVEGNLEVYVYEMTIRMDMKISYKRRNTCFTRCIHLQIFLNFCSKDTTKPLCP